ncbi:MAG: penicillin-binding protein 2 [bacterium]
MMPKPKIPLPGMEKKLVILVGVIAASFLLLVLYFWRLQILQYDNYQRLADNNRIRLVEMLATRGIITDRNGIILADSTPNYSLAVVPEDMDDDWEAELRALARHLSRDPDEAVSRLTESVQNEPYRAVRIFENLDNTEVALIESESDRFPGANLRVIPRRYYPFGQVAAHTLGYVGEVSPEQLASGLYREANMGDIVGKFGLEKIYDNFLRGKDGGRQVEVNAQGKEINVLGITEPVPGLNLVLNIDIRMQEILEEALVGKQGAAVVMDVKSGGILAMVSKPSFDPNEFSLRITRQRWNEILKDPSHPLQNRAVQGVYPPGSTFKVVTAAAALMENAIDPDEELFCPGFYRYGRRNYRDWKLGGHGKVNLFKGIVESCDVYFYQAGERTGIDALSNWAFDLGLGKTTGIDLPGELEGLIPTQEWKRSTKHEPWFPGETLSASIGQGFVLVTPLQMVSLYSTVANRGLLLEPHVLSRIEDVTGAIVEERNPEIKRRSGVSQDAWSRIVEALVGVVENDKGTGRGARLRDFAVAGKTGTAQVVRLEEWRGKKEKEIPWELRDHAWFAAFAPYDDPEVAVAVIVEHGGHGSSAALPIVAQFLWKYKGMKGRMEAVSSGDGSSF